MSVVDANAVIADDLFSHPAIEAQKQERLAQQVLATHVVVPETAQNEAPPAEPEAPTATPPAPPKKWAGKYNTPEDLETGYWNSAQEAARIAAENKVLKAQLEHPRVNPSDRAADRRNFAKELEDAAVPVEALVGLVKEAFREELAPIVRGAQARDTMMARYEDFANNERAMATFMSANPEVESVYNTLVNAGQDSAAYEYAYTKFRSTQPASNPAPAAVVDASGQAQAVARATAALTGSQVGERAVVDSFAQRLDAANRQFQNDGDPHKLAMSLGEFFPFVKVQ
jgi:hypothetical protein